MSNIIISVGLFAYVTGVLTSIWFLHAYYKKSMLIVIDEIHRGYKKALSKMQENILKDLTNTEE